MSSSESDEDFIEYGTALDPLEEGEIPYKKPCLVEDQVAKDKWGRRRFHGAFTGGFSAGFFNTVGSLEGWKPSSFKSSKSEERKVLNQRPEDFMDEEDKDVFGIAPMVLKAKQDYLNVKKRKLNTSSDGSPLTAILKDLLRPVRETVGMRLLKKMGWKTGQGVGARITKLETKKTSELGQKVYGCDLPPAMVEQEELDSDSEIEQLFPEDYDPVLFKPKNNFFGLGYKGLDNTGVLSSFSRDFLPVEEKNKHSQICGQAFGVGAFEEEDEDIYSKEDMSYYDFSLGISDNTHEPTKKTFVDGILGGFVLEIRKPVRKNYLLPILPKNFKFHPKPFLSNFHKIEILGKKALPQSQRNFNYQMGKKVIESVEVQEQNEAAVEKLITNVQIHMNKFKPFCLNPDKQERYEKYLKLIEIGKSDCLSHIQPMTMTEWDKEKEKLEFEQAAKLFKPLSGVMEERFLTASQPDDMSDFLAVTEKFNYGSVDQNRAAKMKMYGTLTRTIEDWVPCHSLCKRFNIPYSTKSCIEGEVRKSKTKSSEPIHELFQTQKGKKEEILVDDDVNSEILTKDGNGKVEQEELQKSSLSKTVNKIDLFRAIFLDGDDEEENKNFKHVEEKEIKNSKELSFDEKVVNSKRNESPPHGIFENIDLEALNILDKARITKQDVPTYSENHKILSDFSENVGHSSDMVHGPKIPDKLVVIKSHVNTKCVADDSEWVEKSFYDKKHKKKIKKKNKKCSRRSSHRHKRVKK